MSNNERRSLRAGDLEPLRAQRTQTLLRHTVRPEVVAALIDTVLASEPARGHRLDVRVVRLPAGPGHQQAFTFTPVSNES